MPPPARPAPDRQDPLAVLMLLGSCVFWGSMAPLTWELSQNYDVFWLALVRYVAGVPILWAATLLMLPARQAAFAPGGPPTMAPVAKLGAAMAFFSVLYTLGVKHSHPVTAPIILMCGPITSALMAWVLLRLRPPSGFWPATALTALGGAIVAMGAPGRGSGLGFQGGEPLLVLAQASWSWYSIRSQQWLGARGQLALTTFTLTAGCVFLAIICTVLGAAGQAPLPEDVPPMRHLLMLLWIGTAGVALATLLWNSAVNRLTLPAAALYMNLSPVVAVIVAAAIGKPPTWMQIAGAAIVFAGVLSLQVRQFLAARRAARPAAP